VESTALARGEPDFSYREYKGTPPRPERSNGHRSARSASLDVSSVERSVEPRLTNRAGSAVSRVLSIAAKGDTVYVELKSGPGKLTATGAVTPNGKPQVEVNVGFKRYEAQRLAATVLAYIHAWDVHRIMTHQQLVSRPAPYLLRATAAAVNDIAEAEMITAGNANATDAADLKYPQETPATGLPAETAGESLPVERKDLVSGTNGVQVATSAQPATSAAIAATAEAIYGPGDLRYGDGSAVNEDNSMELQTFRRFMAEKQTRPASRPALQAYYRQHAALN